MKEKEVGFEIDCSGSKKEFPVFTESVSNIGDANTPTGIRIPEIKTEIASTWVKERL